MSDITEDICANVSKELIEDVLRNYYGFINGKIKQLDGYDDKNFHITVCITYSYILDSTSKNDHVTTLPNEKVTKQWTSTYFYTVIFQDFLYLRYKFIRSVADVFLQFNLHY